ncbi:dNMP kinase [Microcystis phage Mwe-JY26]
MADIVVGITGRKGHGKDTAAQGLYEHGFGPVKFAAPLKRMLEAHLDYLGVSEETVVRMIEGDLKEVETSFLCGKTPRFFMQRLGTEFGRDTIGETFWTDAFKARSAMFERVVCTDMRFPNEVETIKAMGGLTIRVKRPAAMKTGGDDHPSEALIDTLPVDFEVLNIGRPEDLQELVTKLVLQHMEEKQ